VNGNPGTLHRYLKLRQRILGVDELHYYDLAAPLAADAVRSFTFEEARDHLLAALSELVVNGDTAATRKYLDFLSAGGSDHAMALLKKGGVDMTASEPFSLCMAKMNRVMDEMEKILVSLVRIPSASKIANPN
jgi:oligoendopeptidase F